MRESPQTHELAPLRGTTLSGAEAATVLVVEDDPILRSTLGYSLSREGFRCLTAATGESGLEVARAEGDQISVILLDLMLPGIGGLQVLRAVRATSDVPVLVLSARGAEQDRIDGLELGADDYIVKPFALGELIARVRAGVRRRAIAAAQPPSVLLRGPLTIEVDRHRVFARGVELGLRPKEFGLLLTLALAPGRVFSRQELLDGVWGKDVIIDERTVDVHVSWLRGKLASAGVNGGMIRTIYGAGYRFAAADEWVAWGGTETEPIPTA